MTKEGIALLYGNQKNVSDDFEKDQGTWKFSKEKRVVLTIQLIDKMYVHVKLTIL